MKNSKIAKEIRNNIEILKQNDKYTYFRLGEMANYDLDILTSILEGNNADAVHQTHHDQQNNRKIEATLSKYLVTPQIIPYSISQKEKYIKSLGLPQLSALEGVR